MGRRRGLLRSLGPKAPHGGQGHLRLTGEKGGPVLHADHLVYDLFGISNTSLRLVCACHVGDELAVFDVPHVQVGAIPCSV